MSIGHPPRAASLAAPQGMARALIPPLTIILALVTAVALILTAAAIVPPPVPGADAAPRAIAIATAPPSDGFTSLAMSEALDLPSAPVVIGLARLTYAPSAIGPRWALPGPLLIAVESGTLAASLERPGQLSRASGATETATGDLLLRPGDSLALPTSTPATFRSAGRTPAMALAAGVFPAQGTQDGREPMMAIRWTGVWSPAAKTELLAGGWASDLMARSARIQVERLSLVSGESTSLTTQGAQGIAVDAGTLTMVAARGLIWLQHPDGTGEWLSPRATGTLLPGDGALLQRAASTTLRNDGSGPLQILVLTVSADGAA